MTVRRRGSIGKPARRVGAAIAATLALQAPALADRLVVEDRRGDAVNRRVDIDRAVHVHDGRRLVHKVFTYRPWRREDLGALYVLVWLSDDDEAVDRTVSVRPERGGGYRAVVRRGRSGPVTGRVRLRRPNGRTLILSFTRSALASELAAYEWRVQMTWNCQSSIEPGGPVCTPPPPDLTRRVPHDL